MDALVIVTYPHVSGVSENDVQQQYVIRQSPMVPDATFFTDVESGLNQMLNIPAGVDPGSLFGPQISRVLLPSYKVYDITDHLDGSPHGSPVHEGELLALVAPQVASPLPSEVAITVTTRGLLWEDQPVEQPDNADPDTKPQRPRQRRSGRIYWGPLTTWVVDATGGVARVADAAADALGAGMQELRTQLALDGHVWSVWSRANATLYAVSDVQVDNAFDTQRRRGEDATLRQTYPV